MLKSNLFRFKKKYFLTSRLCARDYKWYFYTETFDIKENKFLISPTEWCYVVNNHYSDCPSWFQKLKNNVLIMTIIKSLNMVLIEYEIKLIQTTHFSWGKNQVQVEDYWTFNNEYGIIMKTDYWSLMGETTFYLINSHIENIMVRIDVMKSHLKVNKSLTTQIARIILFSKIITNVVKISLFQEVLDRVKNEGLSINLIDEPIESEVN
ncbi:MAG: hypothetical protein E6Q33_07885 [Neisseriales bacterium]|nr:MAG: hypothetical protein E6Q33_07885 [Neisseriales bacterium]